VVDRVADAITAADVVAAWAIITSVSILSRYILCHARVNGFMFNIFFWCHVTAGDVVAAWVISTFVPILLR
jgi:hypothetical protein